MEARPFGIETRKNKEEKETGKFSIQQRTQKIHIPGENIKSSIGIRTSASSEQMVLCHGLLLRGCFGASLEMAARSQPGFRGWQELLLLIPASAKPLGNFCLRSKVTQ